MKTTKVEVRPAPNKKPWHNLSEKETFTRTKRIQALVNPETLTYATGLSEKDIEHLKEKKKVSYDLSISYDPHNPHAFWDSPIASFKLENRTQIFNEENPLDFIRVRLMKASKYVANSLSEYEEGKFPDATHIMFDEIQEAESKAAKVEIRKQAYLQAAKLGRDRKVQIIRLLGGKNVKGHSDAFVEVALDDLLTENPQDILRMIEKHPEELATEALVYEALDRGVLKKKAGKIMYYESVFGFTEKDVAIFLGKDENQDIQFQIKEAVNK